MTRLSRRRLLRTVLVGGAAAAVGRPPGERGRHVARVGVACIIMAISLAGTLLARLVGLRGSVS
jgi:hypothetical protein